MDPVDELRAMGGGHVLLMGVRPLTPRFRNPINICAVYCTTTCSLRVVNKNFPTGRVKFHFNFGYCRTNEEEEGGECDPHHTNPCNEQFLDGVPSKSCILNGKIIRFLSALLGEAKQPPHIIIAA